jgi:hypothetical protein
MPADLKACLSSIASLSGTREIPPGNTELLSSVLICPEVCSVHFRLGSTGKAALAGVNVTKKYSSSFSPVYFFYEKLYFCNHQKRQATIIVWLDNNNVYRTNSATNHYEGLWYGYPD